MKTYKEIKEYARRQFDRLGQTGDDEGLVGVEYKGSKIIDPWMDPSGRFELSDEEARGLYGKELIDEFVRLVNEKDASL